MKLREIAIRVSYSSALLLATFAQASAQCGANDGLQSFLDELVLTGTPGIAMHLSDDCGSWTGVAGFADVESEQLLKSADTFPVFSVTKTFTAVVVLQLIEEGKLSFDDTLGDIFFLQQGVGPIGKIPYSSEITIRQLLSHSSGIHDFANSIEYLQETLGADADYEKEWSTEEKIAFAHGDRNEPEGRPGSVISYSSTGYELLGLAIEEITKKALGQVFIDRIFKPLGLTDTYLATYSNWTAPDASGYVMMSDSIREMRLATEFPVVTGELVNASKGQRSRQGSGSGEDGIVSSVDSLAIFTEALFDGRLLKSSTLEEMMTPVERPSGAGEVDAEQFGIGLRILTDGDQVWAKLYGNGAGGEAIVGHELNSGLTFVALTNVFGFGVTDRVLDEILVRTK